MSFFFLFLTIFTSCTNIVKSLSETYDFNGWIGKKWRFQGDQKCFITLQMNFFFFEEQQCADIIRKMLYNWADPLYRRSRAIFPSNANQLWAIDKKEWDRKAWVSNVCFLRFDCIFKLFHLDLVLNLSSISIRTPRIRRTFFFHFSRYRWLISHSLKVDCFFFR